jgi:hypothetical protein
MTSGDKFWTFIWSVVTVFLLCLLIVNAYNKSQEHKFDEAMAVKGYNKIQKQYCTEYKTVTEYKLNLIGE